MIRELRKFDYKVSASRPDGTLSPFGISTSYATSIKTNLTAIAMDYYRIASADVQSMALQNALVTASLVIEAMTGMVLIPRDLVVDFTRFPVYDRTLEIPRGPLIITGGNPATLTYTTDVAAPYGSTVVYSISGDYDANAICRLQQDRAYPYFSIISSQIWPVPLWSEPYPVRFSGTFGMFNPTAWAAGTPTDLVAQYSQPLSALLQLALHLYENRMPLNIGNIVTEIPMTLKMLVRSMKR